MFVEGNYTLSHPFKPLLTKTFAGITDLISWDKKIERFKIHYIINQDNFINFTTGEICLCSFLGALENFCNAMCSVQQYVLSLKGKY